MEHQELKENIEEQIRDAMNIMQLLEVELSANEDDEHIIRTVSIVEKMSCIDKPILQAREGRGVAHYFHINQWCLQTHQLIQQLAFLKADF